MRKIYGKKKQNKKTLPPQETYDSFISLVTSVKIQLNYPRFLPIVAEGTGIKSKNLKLQFATEQNIWQKTTTTGIL